MMGPRQTAKADQKVDLNQRRLQLARTRGFTAPGAGEARRSAVADLSRSWIREVWDAATDGARTQGVALASVGSLARGDAGPVSYTHLRAHETDSYLVCRLLLEKK